MKSPTLQRTAIAVPENRDALEVNHCMVLDAGPMEAWAEFRVGEHGFSLFLDSVFALRAACDAIISQYPAQVEKAA